MLVTFNKAYALRSDSKEDYTLLEHRITPGVREIPIITVSFSRYRAMPLCYFTLYVHNFKVLPTLIYCPLPLPCNAFVDQTVQLLTFLSLSASLYAFVHFFLSFQRLYRSFKIEHGLKYGLETQLYYFNGMFLFSIIFITNHYSFK